MATAVLRNKFENIRSEFLKHIDAPESTLEKDHGAYIFKYTKQLPNLKIPSHFKIKISKVEDIGGWVAIRMWRGDRYDWMDINPTVEVRYNIYDAEEYGFPKEFVADVLNFYKHVEFKYKEALKKSYKEGKVSADELITELL
jgi:hypothetical protein